MCLKQLLLIAALVLLPLSALAKVGGDTDKIPAQPTAYTVVCVPEHSDLQAFASDPELVALRQSTELQLYTPSDPDFKHRWADRLPQVRDGQIALIVEQDGKKLFGVAADTLAEVCSAVRSNDVLSKLNRSGCPGGHCPLHRPCPVEHPEEKEREPDVLRPLHLPPLIEKETPKVVEKQAEENPLGVIGIIAAAMAPLSICAGLGSYFITRSVDESEAFE